MSSWGRGVLTSRCLKSGWKGAQKSKVMVRVGAAPGESPEIFKGALPGKKAIYWGLHHFCLQPWHSLLPQPLSCDPSPGVRYHHQSFVPPAKGGSISSQLSLEPLGCLAVLPLVGLVPHQRSQPHALSSFR